MEVALVGNRDRDAGWDLQQADHLRRNAQTNFANLRTRQEQKREHERPGEQQLGVFPLKAQSSSHAFYCLEHQVAQQQRPAHGNHNVQNLIGDRGCLPKIVEVHLEHFQKGIRYILDDFKKQTVDPLNEALKNPFKDRPHPQSFCEKADGFTGALPGPRTAGGCRRGTRPYRL